MHFLTALRDTIRRSWWGRILAEMDTEPVELMGGGAKIVMGVWLLLPFQSFTSSPTFAALSVLPEWLWGTFLLCVGLFHLAALRDGYRGWRKWAALVGFLIWVSFGTVFVWTNPPAIGWVLFMSVGGAQMWASIR